MDDAHQMMAHLKKVGLPTSIKDISRGDFRQPDDGFYYQDKKVQRVQHFILTHGIVSPIQSKMSSG